MKKTIVKNLGVLFLTSIFALTSCSSDDGGKKEADPVTPDFKVTNGVGGEEITNGKVFEFNSIGSEADIHIQVKNLSDENLYFKLKAESGENHTGVPVNFCFGEVCLFNFNPGAYVPPTINDAITIAPGESNDINDKIFITEDAVIENTPVLFNIGLYQYDSPDQDQTTGTKVLEFTYKYNPN